MAETTDRRRQSGGSKPRGGAKKAKPAAARRGDGGQAATHARQARRRAGERRKRAAGGVSGWVSDQAGQWSLDDWDPEWLGRQKYFWNPLVDYWSRMEVEGWENIPEPPVLLIGIHSGAPFV